MQLHLLAALQSTDTYRQALATLHALRASDGVVRRFPALALDLPEAARPYLLAALQADWDGPVLIVTGSPEQRRDLAEQVRLWPARPSGCAISTRPTPSFTTARPGTARRSRRASSVLAALAALRREPSAGRGLVIAASVWALMAKTSPPRWPLRRAAQRLAPGEVVAPVRPARAPGARRL